MTNEIPLREIQNYSGWFPGLQLQMAIDSIAEGNTEGQAWVVSRGEGAIALLWDKGNHVFHVSGDRATDGAVAAFASLMAGPVRDIARESGLSYFRARLIPDSLEAALPALFPGCELSRTVKLFHVLRRPAEDAPDPDPDGVRFPPIDRDLLERAEYENVKAVKAEIAWMWPSLERFYRNGFGRAAAAGGRLVCWCTAEYVSRRACGVGIETAPEFRGRGIATRTALRFSADCARRGITPHWECDRDNAASARVAEKVGFERVETSACWAGRFPP